MLYEYQKGAVILGDRCSSKRQTFFLQEKKKDFKSFLMNRQLHQISRPADKGDVPEANVRTCATQDCDNAMFVW